MGRLAGFSYRQIIKILKSFGLVFHSQAAESYEIRKIRIVSDDSDFYLMIACKSLKIHKRYSYGKCHKRYWQNISRNRVI